MGGGWGGGVANREQRSRSRSRRGGVSKNWTEGATAARPFFLTAVAIAIATRPFKFHEISVSISSSSFVSSIHSFGYKQRAMCLKPPRATNYELSDTTMIVIKCSGRFSTPNIV